MDPNGNLQAKRGSRGDVSREQELGGVVEDQGGPSPRGGPVPLCRHSGVQLGAVHLDLLKGFLPSGHRMH